MVKTRNSSLSVRPTAFRARRGRRRELLAQGLVVICVVGAGCRRWRGFGDTVITKTSFAPQDVSVLELAFRVEFPPRTRVVKAAMWGWMDISLWAEVEFPAEALPALRKGIAFAYRADTEYRLEYIEDVLPWFKVEEDAIADILISEDQYTTIIITKQRDGKVSAFLHARDNRRRPWPPEVFAVFRDE